MRIVQFQLKADPSKVARVGFMNGEDMILDIATVDNTAPSSLIEILKKTPDLLKIDPAGKFTEFEQDLFKLKDVKLLPPITGSDKVICVGMNYKDHCEEQNVPVPEEPIFFNKFASCLHGPFSTIPYPEVTEELDWEVELAVIIKKKGKNIPQEKAYDHVLGYTVAHDVSARDWQLKRNGGQWLIGKSMDGFCPIGPAIVTKKDIADPHNLNIKCRVNGQIKQDSNTRNLVFKIPELIATLSKFVTLLPGDMILTGTPPGVGVFAKPPCFLQPGDIVECEIENLGKICNTIGQSKNIGEMYSDL